MNLESRLKFEIVICRHGENLAWLGNLPKSLKIVVYDKTCGPGPRWPGAVPLPNVGREAHTWLYHLAKNYDRLADWTLFSQGHPFDHAPDMHATIRSLCSENVPESGFQWLGFLWETDNPKGYPTFVNWSKNPGRRELDLDGFFQNLWGTSAPEKIRYVGGGQFILSREVAHRQSRAFYQKALGLASDFPDAAHAFERTWDRVFQAPPLDPSLFPPSGMRMWKPIKAKTDFFRTSERPFPPSVGARKDVPLSETEG